MTLDRVPIFDTLSPDDRAALAAQAVIRRVTAGDVLFYEGDPADTFYVLVSGRCALRRGGAEGGDLDAPALLDPASALGGLPHHVKATALEDGEVWGWPVAALWDHPPFANQARRWLASELHAAQDRRAALEAPVHYADGTAQIAPGPFVFDDVTLIFAFCEAHVDFLTLPDGVSLFRRPGRAWDPVLLALADFPKAYPERDPGAHFGYTETTVFVPVRVGYKIGLYVPYIYPSAYEPMVLGREIYGFPKRLGHTVLVSHAATLAVDGAEQAALRWDGMDASDEPALVGALLAWLGLERWSMALAFRAGDVLRKVMQLFRPTGA